MHIPNFKLIIYSQTIIIFIGDRGIDGLNGLPGRPGLKGEPGL